MSSNADGYAEKISRVQEWCADVQSHANEFSSSFSVPDRRTGIGGLSDALLNLKKHRQDRDASLRELRGLVSDIVLSEHSSADRVKLLEKCRTVARDFYPDANPFASLLCEPMESVGIPPFVYEIYRLSQELSRSHDENHSLDAGRDVFRLHVLQFLIGNWEGTLIPLPGSGSGDLVKTSRRACLRTGDHDSGNDVFQRIRPLLSSKFNSQIRPALDTEYIIEIFPNILKDKLTPSSSRRKAVLAADGLGFTAFICIPDFYETIRRHSSDNSRTQFKIKRTHHSPSSATPSPSSAFSPFSFSDAVISIEFLAARCAWSLEFGRNSLSLTLLDSDGSVESDSRIVDAVVEVILPGDSADIDSRLNQDCAFAFVLPRNRLYFPSHPRTGPNSTCLCPCFRKENPPSPVSGGNPSIQISSAVANMLSRSIHDFSGFDDRQLFRDNSAELSIKLLVKLDGGTASTREPHHLPPIASNHTLRSTSPFVVTGPPMLPSNSDTDGFTSLHRRSTSLPLVKISSPEGNLEPAASDESIHITRASEASLELDLVSGETLRLLPKPPRNVEETPVTKDNYHNGSRSDLGSPSRSPTRQSHSRNQSMTDLHQMTSSRVPRTSEFRTESRKRAAEIPHHSAPSSVTMIHRPLPKPPLTIDTVNLMPSQYQLHRPLSPLSSLDPPATITCESTPVGNFSNGLKASTSSCLGYCPKSSSATSLLDLPRMLTSSTPEHLLTARNGRFRTGLKPLTPVSSDRNQSRSYLEASGTSEGRNWRDDMFREVEETFSVDLPENRISHWQELRETLIIYPLTTHYLAQYLHWWSQESGKFVEESLSVRSLLKKTNDLSTGSPLKVIGTQELTREYLVGLLLRTEKASYQECRDSKMNRIWSNLLRRAFKLDEDDLALSMTSMLERRSVDVVVREATALNSDNLLNLMDVLQSLIDRQYGTHRVLERFIQKIVNVTGLLPKYLFLSNVKRIGDNPIAGGGFADVWKGKSGERAVALKVLRIFGLANPSNHHHQDFCKEAMIWRQFRHQNVLPFYGVCIDVFSPQLALISPWMPNGDVLSHLKRSPDVNRITLLVGIALGLYYLHSLRPLVVHGDLRAANVLVDERGRPKLADFGLAKIVDSQASSIAATSFNGKGAMRWQSPELLDSSRFTGLPCGITTYSDVYAFASVCLEVFTEDIPFSHLRDGEVVLEVAVRDKRPPRPPDSSPAARRGLTDELWTLMQSCWATHPLERPDIEKVVQDLTVDCP